MKKHMGRPRLPLEERKISKVDFVCLQTERERYVVAARTAGLMLSQWIRRTLNSACPQMTPSEPQR